jgi:hypothetical protein
MKMNLTRGSLDSAARYDSAWGIPAFLFDGRLVSSRFDVSPTRCSRLLCRDVISDPCCAHIGTIRLAKVLFRLRRVKITNSWDHIIFQSRVRPISICCCE